ncbi:MAG: toxin [Rhizobium sp.]|nr:toxin [Rhizobium sp.]
MTEISINGWKIYLHPLFLDQQKLMIEEVRKARAADPANFESKRCTKILRALRKVAVREIPRDPFDPQYRQGSTLGDDYKHWFRGKFLQQYRLFFRFSEKERIIILVWVNDEDTKRAYESKNDAYRTFRKMLDRGRPPNDWATLLKEAKAVASPALDSDI